MLCFLAAFLAFCFDNTDLIIRMPMGIGAGFIALMLVVYLIYAWEYSNGPSKEWFSLKEASIKDHVEHTKERSKAWFCIFPRRPQPEDLEVNHGSDAIPMGSSALPM